MSRDNDQKRGNLLLIDASKGKLTLNQLLINISKGQSTCDQRFQEKSHCLIDPSKEVTQSVIEILREISHHHQKSTWFMPKSCETNPPKGK